MKGLHQGAVKPNSHWFYKKIIWMEPLKVAADHATLTTSMVYRVGHNERGIIKEIIAGFAFDGGTADNVVTIAKHVKGQTLANWAALVTALKQVGTVTLAGTEGHGVAKKMSLTLANTELLYGDILFITTTGTYTGKRGLFVEIRYTPYDDVYNETVDQDI